MRLWRIGRRRAFSPIGLDIGRCGVRAAQIEWSRGGWSQSGARVRTACWSWRGSAVRAEGGAPWDNAQWQSETVERLRRLLRQNDFRGRAAVVGLSSPDVELHALELPLRGAAVSHRDLRQAAHWELERLMSFEKGEVESDYWALPPSRATATTALGVAARKTLVDRIGHLCRTAGLECRRVDAGVCALARFSAWARGAGPGPHAASAVPPEPGPGDIWGALDLGHRQSRLALCVDETPVVVRTFDSGCERWIGLLAEALELTPDAAEIHLRDHGIQRTGRGMRAEERGPEPTASAQLGGIIRNVLRAELEALCREVERSYRYALECYPNRKSGELILAGGGSEINHLASYLADKLGIPVWTAAERWAALVKSQRSEVRGRKACAGTAPREPAGVLACAVGLAVEPQEQA